MEAALVIGAILAIPSAFFAQYVASARGHHSLLFFWVGFFIPVVGILVAFLTPAPTASTGQRDVADEPGPSADDAIVSGLTELARLHETGLLTDDEFVEAKRRVLSGRTEPGSPQAEQVVGEATPVGAHTQAPVDSGQCRSCGEPLGENDVFCGHCGARARPRST